MNPGLVAIIVISIILVIILIVFISCIRIIRQTEKAVVERLGKYLKTWDTGIHMLLPFVDRVAHKVSMKEQVHDFPPQPVITKDNVTM